MNDWVVIEPPKEEFILIKKTPFAEPVWGKVVNKN